MSYSTKFRMLLLSIMVVGLALALLLRQGDSPEIDPTDTPVAQASPPSSTLLAEDPAQEFQDTEGHGESEDLNTHQAAPLPPAPALDVAREEVRNNPHTPPKSLLQFANQIADRFDDVEKNPDQADAFMSELEDCVRDGNNRLTSARALCLTNAEDLGAMFPQLAERLNQLKASAPSEIRDLARATSMGYEE